MYHLLANVTSKWLVAVSFISKVCLEMISISMISVEWFARELAGGDAYVFFLYDCTQIIYISTDVE